MAIKVLIVDDIAETRDNVGRLLSLNDEFSVIGEAGDGEEALTQAARLRPDIILMDINMPGMDGMTACRQINYRYPECGIIMMTVQGGVEYIQRAYAEGAKGYVVKPFSSDELMAAIRRVFNMNRQSRGTVKPLANLEEQPPTTVLADRPHRFLKHGKTAGING